MIVNPGKPKSSFIHKSSQTSKPKQFLIGNDVVEVASSVKFLGMHIDDQLSFNLHISNICNYVSKQLSALMRLKCFLGFEERKVLINNSSHEELLKKSGKSTVNVSNYRSLCIEIFKILNDTSPSFIKDIFKLRMTSRPSNTREL